MVLDAELPRFGLSPGVSDMRTDGRMLFGDPSVLEMLPLGRGGVLGEGEETILLENRAASLLGAEGMPDLEFFYGISKVYTDIAVAFLASKGSYVSGYRNRNDAFSRMFGGNDPGLAEKVGRWTGFKLDPEKLPASSVREGLFEEAASDLLEAYSACGAYSSKGVMHNLRSWKSHGCSLSTMVRIGSRVLRNTPLELVRKEAIRLLKSRVGGGEGAIVSRAPGGFPHGGGSWREAAGRCNAEWERLVHGKKG
jgi:hypothetical protein